MEVCRSSYRQTLFLDPIALHFSNLETSATRPARVLLVFGMVYGSQNKSHITENNFGNFGGVEEHRGTSPSLIFSAKALFHSPLFSQELMAAWEPWRGFTTCWKLLIINGELLGSFHGHPKVWMVYNGLQWNILSKLDDLGLPPFLETSISESPTWFRAPVWCKMKQNCCDRSQTCAFLCHRKPTNRVPRDTVDDDIWADSSTRSCFKQV